MRAAEFPVTEEVIGDICTAEKSVGILPHTTGCSGTRKKEYAPAELLSGTMDGERLRRPGKNDGRSGSG